jgi:AcrR family transcriptional regulator
MPRIVDKETKKLEILLAAMQVFARKGIVSTKMIDIARAAGIGKGTIYEYFRSKDDIFISAFHYFFSNIDKMIREVVDNESDPLSQLQLLVETSLQAMLHAGDQFTEIIMDFWAEGVRNKNEKMMTAMDLKGIYVRYRNLIQKILKNGIKSGVFRDMDTGATASALIGALDGIMLQWILHREAVNLKKVTIALLDAFVEGIRNK